jgi:hypothetical protein
LLGKCLPFGSNGSTISTYTISYIAVFVPGAYAIADLTLPNAKRLRL